MSYVVKKKIVKVSIGALGGHKVAHILSLGDTVPEGVSEEQVAGLVERGLIEEIAEPDLAEIEAQIAAQEEAEKAAFQAEFDAAVQVAAEKIVADRDEAAAAATETAASTTKAPAASKTPAK